MTEPDALPVLLVEDEMLLRELLSEALQDAGFEVWQAADGETALAALRRPVRALVTDIRLPGRMSGWDIAEAARLVQPAVAVVYVTGYSDEAPRPVAGSTLLRKPFHISTLIEILSTGS